MKFKKLLATILTVALLVTLFPATMMVSAAVPVASTGIVFTKTAQAKADGTVDITMEAYTTGKVTNSQSAVPADIVLVLDVSGSMDEIAAHSPHKVAINGTRWVPILSPHYGFSDDSINYYIGNGAGGYTQVTFVDYDDSGFLGADIGHKYYTDGVSYYYPKLESGVDTSGRTQSYQEKQFYRDMTHMEILKEGADAFIADVATKNESIPDDKDKHRISIVKFGSADYYNGSQATDDHTQAVVGDNRASNGYNYTQVVKGLTVVNAAGKTELTNAMNGLVSGGATAVDYGLQLAEDVLGARDSSETVGRSEAIIVFTDGSPTHGSGYEAAVAGAAIDEALALKDAGVKIFAIGGADTADSSILGDNSNQFMHYVSNNFPKADYAGGTIVPGDGSITNGYYMTPSEDKNLENIFEDIFKQTVNLDITLGETAGVIDTISPYFTIPGVDEAAKAAKVTVKTAKKTASGWDAPETLTGATVDITGNTLTVRGFDFDANYVSEAPRTVDGADFYGKKLIITINVAPDYDEIDLHKANFIGGAIPTNEGLASVVNSANEAVITADSPTILAKKVTYKVDGQDYAYLYRLPGANVNVISDVPEKEGHTFNGWDRTGSFTMPNDDVVINGSFTAEEYDVTYVFSGNLPTGTVNTDLPNGGASVKVTYGTDYTVAPPINTAAGTKFEGYQFVGWTPRQENVIIQDGKFKMPANNVTLIGYFMPDDDTAYKIEHYTETFNDGEFELKETENKFGETDKEVTATPTTYTGFTFDRSVTGTVITDTIEGDGSTVLKLYYTRNKYNVFYEFDGTVPSGVTAPGGVIKKYGESYTIEVAMNIPGYEFKGWYYTSDLTYTNVSGNTITVDRDIYLAGEFTAKNDTPYIVEHWIQNANDDNYTLDTHLTETLSGTTDTDATAYARMLEGLTFNATKTNDELPSNQSLDTTGTIASITANIDRNGDTVIKFYYDRLTYKVTYRFEGTVPSDAPDISGLAQLDVRHGATVTVDTTIPNLADWPTGYTGFYGWYRGAAIDANRVTEFTMPARDVELLGYFIPSNNTAYIVKHFLQNADDDNYTEDTSRRETLRGKTLDYVKAYPLPTILGLGYTYNETLSTDEGQIVADGSLELILYYDRITYNVTYQYINKPTGAAINEPTDNTEYRHGKEVLFDTTAQVVAGYTFHGWHIQDANITTTATGFIMPSRDVVIYGAWTANSNTAYTVEHYYEGLNGTFGDGEGNATPKFTETQHTGTTGQLAVAAEIPQAGFTFDTSIPGTVASATIAGDGGTILKLYYKRNTYKVTYEYSGAMPDAAFETAANAQLPNGGVAYELKYGATHQIQPVVNIAANAALTGYSFHGWTPNDTALVITGNEFTMPMHDVILVGHFHPNTNTPYTINHFLETEAEGVYPTVPNYTENRPGETNANATVYARKYDGFVIDLDTTTGETVGGDYTTITKKIEGDGSTEFNFYYKRIAYNVKYELDGLQPHGVNLTEHQTTISTYNHNALYGTTVTVKADLSQEGYTFDGWHSADPAVGKNDASFTMPAKEVVLKGKFVAKTDTAYKVEYYLQKLNAEETAVAGTNKTTDYELQTADTFNGTGTTGHTATAVVKHYDGFVARTDNVINAIISGDGLTVIKLYYDRVTNPIEYHFYGEHPDHQASELPAKEENVPYGVKRTVAAKISCDPSHRHVPTDWASPHIAPVGGEFRMPATKVDFYAALRHIYKVEYDLNGGTGVADVAYGAIDVFAGTVIDVKPAATKAYHSFDGWKLNGTDTIYNPTEEIIVNKDIKLIAQWTYTGGGGGGGGGVTRYTLTYDTNGGSAIAKETYNSGATVKLTKVPKKDGYIFDGWHLDSALSEDVDEVKMTKNITVYADWVEDNGNAGNGHDTPGSLNGEDHFAYVVGYPDGTVRPNDHIDRAEVTTIFFRLLKEDVRAANLTAMNSFGDVNAEDWHNKAISTMAKLGIVKGRYADAFVPDAFITRAEFAVICARFDDSEFEVVDEFTDVQGHWAEAEIHEAAAHGWIRGYEDNTFKPDQLITRAEAMTMINRVLNRVPETVDDLLDEMIKWPDNNNTAEWYYIPVQEATNGHNFIKKNNIYEKWTELTEEIDWTQYQ